MKTVVLPINFYDDLENIAVRDKCNVVGIDEIKITYTQPADTCSSSDEVQSLTISTQCACCASEDEPEGFYFNITIPEGSHWSVDDGDSLKALIEDFKKRLYLSTEHYTETTKKKENETINTDN